jgi:hypothetical protein
LTLAGQINLAIFPFEAIEYSDSFITDNNKLKDPYRYLMKKAQEWCGINNTAPDYRFRDDANAYHEIPDESPLYIKQTRLVKKKDASTYTSNNRTSSTMSQPKTPAFNRTLAPTDQLAHIEKEMERWPIVIAQTPVPDYYGKELHALAKKVIHNLYREKEYVLSLLGDQSEEENKHRQDELIHTQES